MINRKCKNAKKQMPQLQNRKWREMHLKTYEALAHTGACIRPQPLNALNFNVKHNQLC